MSSTFIPTQPQPMAALSRWLMEIGSPPLGHSCPDAPARALRGDRGHSGIEGWQPAQGGRRTQFWLGNEFCIVLH